MLYNSTISRINKYDIVILTLYKLNSFDASGIHAIKYISFRKHNTKHTK